jgi:hypothetical protein
MREFRAITWSRIDGRDWASVALDQDEPGQREVLLRKLQAEGGVIIDGKEYQIDGVTSFATLGLSEGALVALRIASSTPGDRP